ncbi:MAG TPA: hypothetical protein VEL74_11095 [Thermoanaerobaculia bacterium]|nr:hypothetical protein [Thermoanaerobaculia bacterium]
MSSQSPRRTLVLAALLAVLAVPALQAQPLTVPSMDNWLSRLWSHVEVLFEKEGASIDPDGRNAAPPAPPSTGGDAGVSIDPDGIHAAGGEGVIAGPKS